MIDLDREILETALRQPGLTIGGLADHVAPGGETQSRIQFLIERGFLSYDAGVKLTERGRNRILAASLRNRTRSCLIGVLRLVPFFGRLVR
ncbi:MAG: hypothetical protein OXK76_07575 [Gammaproteobacteria bacterium]|nr:hypothetical protein [Gammaproteobacteria bacterium]